MSKEINKGEEKVLSIDISLQLEDQPIAIQDMIMELGFDNMADYLNSLGADAGPNADAHIEEEEYTDEDLKSDPTEPTEKKNHEGLKSEPTEEEKQAQRDAVAFMKGFRELLDLDYKLMNEYCPFGAKDVLRAKHWAGKLLGAYGEPYPYPAAEEVKDIPATVDTALEDALQSGRQQLVNMDMLGRCNYFRNSISLLSQSIEAHGESYGPDSRHEAIYMTQIYIKLQEASFELGEELGAIRERGY